MWIGDQGRAVIHCLRCQTWISEWADIGQSPDQVCEQLERKAREAGWVTVGWTGWGLCPRCVSWARSA